MDENKTNEKIENETTGENSSGTTNKPVNLPSGKLFGWLAKYYDEEKYPPKPTPWFVYVLSVPVGFGLTWLTYQGIELFAASLGKADEVNSPFVWTMVCFLFLAFMFLFVNLCRCVDRYGLWETAWLIPKAILFAIVIVALGLLVFFFCVSPYFGIVACFLFGLLIGSIIRAGKKQNPPV